MELLFLSIFLSRYILVKSDLGELLQVLILSSFFVTISSSFPLALNYYHGKYETDSIQQRSLFAKFVIALSGVSVLVVLLVLAIHRPLANIFENGLFEGYIGWIVSYYSLKILNTIFPNYHYLRHTLRSYLFFYSGSSIFLLGALVVLQRAGQFSILNVLWLLIGVELIRLGINYFVLRDKKVELHLTPRLFTDQEWTYIGTLTLGVSLGAFNLYVDRYMVAIILNPGEFAFYQNGAINLPFANIITSSLFIALIPVFADYSRTEKWQEVLRVCREASLKCTWLLIPIITYCFFEAVALVKLIYGESFERSGEVFKIYVLKYSLGVIAYSVMMGSIGLEKKSNMVILVSGILALLCNAVLIPWLGTKGAAWSAVISSLSTIFISLGIIGRRLKVPIWEVFPVKGYAQIFLTSVVTYLPFYFVNKYIPVHLIVVVSSLFYYVVVLLITNYYLGFIEIEKYLKFGK